MVLVRISLVLGDIKHLFTCLLVFFEEMSIQVVCSIFFLSWVILMAVVELQDFLDILDICLNFLVSVTKCPKEATLGRKGLISP